MRGLRVALSAARETGTNSIPRPRPTGISGTIVTDAAEA